VKNKDFPIVNHIVIDWSGYADDLMLVFNSKEELQKALTLLSNTFERFNLQINIDKTKTRLLNQHHENTSYPGTILSSRNQLKM